MKWPNDVLVDGGKLAGVLVEARPQSGWAVLGIGVNVAVELASLPLDLRAATLGRPPRRWRERSTSCSHAWSAGWRSRPRIA